MAMGCALRKHRFLTVFFVIVAFPLVLLFLAERAFTAVSAGTSDAFDATADSNGRRIVRDTSNNIHVVYFNAGEIYYIKSTDSGKTWSAPANISSTGANSVYPSIAVDSGNNLHVVWQDATPGNDDIYYKKYSGGSWSGVTNISNNGANSRNPSIAVDTANNLHVVWHDFTPGVNPDIYYSKYSAAAWSAPAAIAATAGTSALPSVVTDTSNNVHVLWADDTDGDYDVNFSKYTTSWSAPANVSSNAGSSMGTSVASVTIDSSNNLYAVWHDDTSGNHEIYYSTYNGTSWSAPANISSNAGVSEVPTISILGTTLYVVWQDDISGDDDIWFSKYTGAWSGPVNLNSSAGVNSLYPNLPFKVPSTSPEMVWTEGNANPFTVTFQYVDTTVPSAVGAVNDGTGGDIDFVNTTNTLSANWTAATDAESGIFKYWTGIGTAPGATDIGGWESAGFNLSTTRTGLALVEGTTYYFTVKAENGGGGQGPVLNSDGQKVDRTGPAVVCSPSPAAFSPEGDTTNDKTAFTLSATDVNGIKDWTLNIYNQTADCVVVGPLIKSFSGTGSPPGILEWDGKNSSSKLLSNSVGTVYCAIFLARDDADNQTQVGATLGIGALPRKSGTAAATAYSGSHKVVRDSSNRIHAVYDSKDPMFSTTGSVREIYYTSSTDEGVTWTFPTNLSNSSDDSSSPGLAIDSIGTLHAVWEENVGGTNKEIYYVSFSGGAGNPFSGAPANISNVAGNSLRPSISVDSSNLLHVVWEDNELGNYEIYYKKKSGSWDAAPANLSNNAGASTSASIHAQTSTDIHAAWSDTTPGNADIFYSKYNGSWSSSENISNSAGASIDPALVKDGSGNVHAVWTDNTGGDNDIYYKMHNGTAWDVAATDVSSNASDSKEPSIGRDLTNNVIAAAWADNNAGDYDVYYKVRSLANGWGAFVRNLNDTVPDSHYPSLNVKAVSAGMDCIWTEGNGAPFDIFYGKLDTIPPYVISLSSPSHPLQTTWYNDNTPQWDFDGSDNAGGTGAYGSYRLVNTTATETASNVRATGTYQVVGTLTYTSGALADGISYFHLIYEDNAGNLSTVSTYTTRVDTSAPLALATPNDGTGADVDVWYYGTYLSANWTATTDPHSSVTKYLSAVFQMNGACIDGGVCLEADDAQLEAFDDSGLGLSTTHNGFALAPGTTYYFGIKARNGASLETAVAKTDGVVYTVDVTAPANIATVNDGSLASDVDYTSNTTQLSANWTASSDPETGVAKYWYAIYQKQGAFIDPGGGEADDTTILGFTDNGTATNVTKSGLTLTDGQLYYFGIKAENGIGLQSAVTKSDGVIVDTTAPSTAGAVNDGTGVDIDSQATATTIDANWTAATDAQSGICKYWVAVGTTPGSNGVAGWDDAGVLLATTRAGLALTHNTTYYVSVKAENCAAYQGSYLSSDGVKIDSQGPTVNTQTSSTHASQSSWYNNALPSYTWSASDGTGESGLLSCYRLLDQVASPAAATVKATGTAVGASGTFTQGTPLADGTWYFHVVCEDNYNNLGAVRNYTTNIDTGTPTAIANVYDGAGADIATTAYLDELSANWTTSSDALSGIAKYWYGIYERAGTCIDGVGPCVEADDVSVVSFYDNGTATNVTDTTVILSSAKTYYFSVKAQDGAGNYSAVTKSNGVTTNNNGPTILTLTSSTHATQTNWYTSNLPSYSWTSQDNGGSGIAKYYYVLNTTTSMTASQIKAANQFITHPTTTFTQGTAKSDGTWYFHLIAEDNNGMLSPSETKYATKIDASGPTTIAAVYDGTTTTDAQYSSSTTALSANWTASTDGQSGIAKYIYSIYLKAGTCIDNANGGTGCAEVNDTAVVSSADNGTAASVTRTGLTLTDGQVYYFSVKAQNGSGLQGTLKASNGITLDSTAPSAPAYVYDGTAADISYTVSVDTLSANWAASSDAQTGIAKYYYAIYKLNGACVDGGSCAETDDTSVVSFTSNGTAASKTQASLLLSSGSAYYYAVKAENGAGGQSAVTNSNGIIVDTAVPAFSSLTSSTHPVESSYYPGKLPSLSWTASDNSGGSGINKYYYLLNQTTTETASNVKTTGTQAASTVTTFTQGTALSDGTYYFHLVVDDAMGNLSTTSRYAVNIDATVPTVSSVNHSPTSNSATITWTSSEAADSMVEYGLTTTYSAALTDAVMQTSHSINIVGLTANTTYHYRVTSKDVAGNSVSSTDQTFTTTIDNVPPTLTSVTSTTHPDTLKWYSNAKPSLTWVATDDKGVSGAYILFDAATSQLATAVFASGTFTSLTTYVQPTNLADGVWYAHVAAKDSGGNLSNVIDYKVQIDASPPVDITIYDGTGTDIDFTNSTTSLSATWSPSSDAQSGFSKYYLAIGTTSGGTEVMAYTDVGTVTSYTKTGLTLTAGTTYYVSVKAENTIGLVSNVATTNGVTVDVTAPKALSSSATEETTVVVTFDEAMDKTSAQTGSNYTISPNLSIIKAILSDDKKTITVTTASQSIGKNYTVTISGVKDLAGNSISPSGNTVTFKGRKTKAFASGKTLMALPFIPDTADPNLFFGTSNLTLKGFDAGTQSVKLESALEIQKGYMLSLTSALTLNVTGTAVAQDAGSPYRTISLKPGWNLIGNPFDADILITALNVQKGSETKTLEDAENNWWVGAFLWTYYEGSYKLVHASIPGASRYVEPWRGYLIYAVENCNLIFPVSSTTKAKEDALPFAGGVHWSVQIAAKTSQAKDDANFGGVVKAARNWSVSEPPVVEENEPYVRVYFEDKGKKLTSFYKTGRNKDESISFTVETNAKTGENVELSFAFTGNLEGLGVMLTDEKTGKTAPLSKDGSYSYVNDGAARTFKIEVKDKAKEEAKNRPLNITKLHNYPNPDRVGNTTFKYAVDGNVAFVMIEVYTMTGKVIEKFTGELDGDTVWKFGDSLPNGVYIYRLVVTDVNGNKTSKVSKLVVLK